MSARMLGVCAAAVSGMLVAAAPAWAVLPPAPDVIGSVTGAIPTLPGDPVGAIVDGLPSGIEVPGVGTVPLPGGGPVVGAPDGGAGGGGGGTPQLPAVAVPPVSFTGSATDVQSDRATVTGLVVAGTAPARYAFEYGTSTAYGTRSTEVELPATVAPVAVTATLTGMPAGSTVHYRLVATSSAGTSQGLDRPVTLRPAPKVLEQLLAAIRGGGGGGAGGSAGAGTGKAGGPSAAGIVQTAPDPAIGQQSDLTVQTASGGEPVSGIVADFDEDDTRIAALACREDDDGGPVREGPLAPNGTGTFALAYAFRRGGAHEVRIDLLGGDCTNERRTLRSLRSTVTPRVVARAAAPPASAAAGRDGQCADANLRPSRRNVKRIERAVRCLIARERAAHGLPPLRPSHRLSVTARKHTSDMVRRGYLAHARPGGPRLAGRLRAAGYAGRGGETIGLGSGTLRTPRAIVASWMGSTVHRDVILRKRYRAIGVGVAPRAPMRMGLRAATYTANFGTRP